jgi:hypothetical protein
MECSRFLRPLQDIFKNFRLRIFFWGTNGKSEGFFQSVEEGFEHDFTSKIAVFNYSGCIFHKIPFFRKLSFIEND